MRCLGLFICMVVAALLAAENAEPEFRRGVNIAGAEFGKVPGTIHKDFTYNNEQTFRYFGEKGFDVFRVPVKWERIQPQLNGSLDAENLAALRKNIEWAKKYDSTVLIDLHNYARRHVTIDGKDKSAVIDAEIGGRVPLTREHLADVWLKLSKEFKDEPAVYGYGLMNEPNKMGNSSWKEISNAVVKAIRASGDRKLILVGGDHWSNAAGWEKHNGEKSWIEDPDNNFIYEAHCYFDSDNSGSYKQTYEDELKKNAELPNVGVRRARNFIDWCAKNKVRGFIGEYGVPGNDERWNTVLENFMSALDDARMGGAYWAAGTYWGKYPLSVQPSKDDKDQPQMAVLLKHLSPAGRAARK